MGTSKLATYDEQTIQLAEQFKALAHPARLNIFRYLLAQKSCVCGSIVKEVGLSQSTVSQHLKELKNSGLIQGTIEGTSTCYCVNTEKLANFSLAIKSLEKTCC